MEVWNSLSGLHANNVTTSVNSNLTLATPGKIERLKLEDIGKENVDKLAYFIKRELVIRAN